MCPEGQNCPQVTQTLVPAAFRKKHMKKGRGSSVSKFTENKFTLEQFVTVSLNTVQLNENGKDHL
jgi:hypothetical protein